MEDLIIIIYDNKSETYLIESALEELKQGNFFKHFKSSPEAFEYLMHTDDSIKLIISDLMLPKISGIELKQELDKHEKSKLKSIPFILLSDASSQENLKKAFKANVQGFFEKPTTFDELVSLLKTICDYWTKCKRYEEDNFLNANAGNWSGNSF